MYSIVMMNKKEIVILWPTDITLLTELTRFEDRWNFRNAYTICTILITIMLKKVGCVDKLRCFLMYNFTAQDNPQL